MNRPVPFQPARRRAQRDRGRSGSQHSANGDDSDDELAALIAAAGDLPHPLRADTHQTMIALLAVTGLRIGEAISLDINDLDPERGVLVVREGKFSKSSWPDGHPGRMKSRSLRGPLAAAAFWSWCL